MPSVLFLFKLAKEAASLRKSALDTKAILGPIAGESKGFLNSLLSSPHLATGAGYGALLGGGVGLAREALDEKKKKKEYLQSALLGSAAGGIGGGALGAAAGMLPKVGFDWNSLVPDMSNPATRYGLMGAGGGAGLGLLSEAMRSRDDENDSKNYLTSALAGAGIGGLGGAALGYGLNSRNSLTEADLKDHPAARINEQGKVVTKVPNSNREVPYNHPASIGMTPEDAMRAARYGVNPGEKIDVNNIKNLSPITGQDLAKNTVENLPLPMKPSAQRMLANETGRMADDLGVFAGGLAPSTKPVSGNIKEPVTGADLANSNRPDFSTYPPEIQRLLPDPSKTSPAFPQVYGGGGGWK